MEVMTKLVSEVKADPEDATNSFILHKLMISMNKSVMNQI